MPVADYVKDQVLVVIQRADPASVSKEDLQEQTGLGAGDLRDALAELEADGLVEWGKDGYELLDSIQGLIPAAAQPRPRTDEEEPEAASDPEPGSPLPAGEPEEGAICEARIELVVRYRAETDEPVKEAGIVAQAAKEGVLRTYPELDVSGRIVSVLAYDNPRTLYEA